MLHIRSETFSHPRDLCKKIIFLTTLFLNDLLDIYIKQSFESSWIFAWRKNLKHFNRWKADASNFLLRASAISHRIRRQSSETELSELIKLVSLLNTGFRHGHYTGNSVKLRGLTLTVITRQENVSCVGRCRAILIALRWEDGECVSNPSKLPT